MSGFLWGNAQLESRQYADGIIKDPDCEPDDNDSLLMYRRISWWTYYCDCTFYHYDWMLTSTLILIRMFFWKNLSTHMRDSTCVSSSDRDLFWTPFHYERGISDHLIYVCANNRNGHDGLVTWDSEIIWFILRKPYVY